VAEQAGSGDRITANILSPVSGQIGVGKRISQVCVGGDVSTPGAADLSQLRETIAALRDRVAAEAPPERRGEALELVTEIEEALSAESPNLSAMEYVRNWFTRHIPRLAGMVTSLLVDPIVGKLVQAGGDALVSEYELRFGGPTSECD
jgi:hypothetical protein